MYRTAIQITAARHYDHDQIAAWVGKNIDLDRWDQKRSTAWTVVAELDRAVVGFSDLTPDGELDMLFVHPDAGGQGLARQLIMTVLTETLQFSRVTTHASRAAQPVFEHFGLITDAENPHNMVQGVTFQTSTYTSTSEPTETPPRGASSARYEPIFWTVQWFGGGAARMRTET